jgi:hypothetical protein
MHGVTSVQLQQAQVGLLSLILFRRAHPRVIIQALLLVVLLFRCIRGPSKGSTRLHSLDLSAKVVQTFFTNITGQSNPMHLLVKVPAGSTVRTSEPKESASVSPTVTDVNQQVKLNVHTNLAGLVKCATLTGLHGCLDPYKGWSVLGYQKVRIVHIVHLVNGAAKFMSLPCSYSQQRAHNTGIMVWGQWMRLLAYFVVCVGQLKLVNNPIATFRKPCTAVIFPGQTTIKVDTKI